MSAFEEEILEIINRYNVIAVYGAHGNLYLEDKDGNLVKIRTSDELHKKLSEK